MVKSVSSSSVSDNLVTGAMLSRIWVDGWWNASRTRHGRLGNISSTQLGVFRIDWRVLYEVPLAKMLLVCLVVLSSDEESTMRYGLRVRVGSSGWRRSLE